MSDKAAGAYLRRLRKSTGMSPEQLGAVCNVSGQAIRNAEDKGTIPHDLTQMKLARYFGKESWEIWTVQRTIPKKVAA